jgi:hypothetical protein
MRERVCRLQLLLALASAVILGPKSRGTHDHILLSQIRDSPNVEGQVLVFIFPRNRVAQLYSQALGPLSVTSYDSQGYGGGIQNRLHTGMVLASAAVLAIQPRHRAHRKQFPTFFDCCTLIRCRGNVLTQPLPRNGPCNNATTTYI